MRAVLALLLFSLAIMCFNLAQSASKMGEIGIFTEATSWMDVASANSAAQIIKKKTKLIKKIEVYNDKDIGKFAEKRIDNDALDIIITFGYFPVSLYKPGNAEKEDSIAEKFLEGGNMFINTADYIFYVTEGGGANGADGLKTITDSTFDMWGDGNSSKPTADGKKYTPSLKPAPAVRPFKIDQIKADKNWEIEVVFGDNNGGGGSMADPIIIRNKEHNGRVCIALQTGGAHPRGEVIHEIIDNYVKNEIASAFSVDANSKLPATWGKIKKLYN